VKHLLSAANLPKTLKDKQDEDGIVRIETSDKIYEITYVRVIPPSDCMEEYKKREMEKLNRAFNLKLI